MSSLTPFPILNSYRGPTQPAQPATVSIATTLASSRKDQENGAEQPVCPDEPQNRLTSLARSLKAPPLHL